MASAHGGLENQGLLPDAHQSRFRASGCHQRKEIFRREDKVYFLEPSDFTHYSDLSQKSPDRKKGPSLCGLELKYERFVSLGMAVATCAKCVEAAEKLKEAKA